MHHAVQGAAGVRRFDIEAGPLDAVLGKEVQQADAVDGETITEGSKILMVIFASLWFLFEGSFSDLSPALVQKAILHQAIQPSPRA